MNARHAPSFNAIFWFVKRIKVSIVAMGFLLGGCEKTQLDEEVKRLCAKDGGIKVHETVVLPPEKFDQYGEVRVSERRLASLNDEFVYDWNVSYLKEGNPSLKRNHFKLYRLIDGKLLAEGIGYARSGGDLPGPWHESSFSCPENYSIKYIAKQAFAVSKIKEAQK